MIKDLYQSMLLQKLIDESQFVRIHDLDKPMIVKNKALTYDAESVFNKGADFTFEILQRAERAVFRNVLKQILKRDPLPEDEKRLQKGFVKGHELDYSLAFDGVLIGKVKYNFPEYNFSSREAPKINVEFIPLDHFKSSE